MKEKLEHRKKTLNSEQGIHDKMENEISSRVNIGFKHLKQTATALAITELSC